ncbi:hypothetical protein H9P43_005404 [Blastocladiella emersonii ATCC 22665]|nr:hypothetical protein H9P43_005404 [Blastocladiella emersonii ATCC 22665]
MSSTTLASHPPPCDLLAAAAAAATSSHRPTTDATIACAHASPHPPPPDADESAPPDDNGEIRISGASSVASPTPSSSPASLNCSTASERDAPTPRDGDGDMEQQPPSAAAARPPALDMSKVHDPPAGGANGFHAAALLASLTTLRTPLDLPGRQQLFGAALHPDFLAAVQLSEEVLGIGAHAVVIRGTVRSGPDTGMPVAVKFIFRDRAMRRHVRKTFGAGHGRASLSPTPGDLDSLPLPHSDSALTLRDGMSPSNPPLTPLTPSTPASATLSLRRIPAAPDALPNEIRVLSQLRHKCMIRYVAHYEDPAFYYLVLELAGPTVAWSECLPDRAWNHEEPNKGYGEAMSTPASPRAGHLAFSIPGSAALVSATSESGARTPQQQQQATWDPHHEVQLATPLVSPSRETVEAYLASEATLPPLPLWKTSRDLFECLDRFGPFCENRARIVFRQVVDAVTYLHSENICHRDIKDENVLVDQDLNVKLIDFGSAGPLDELQHGAFGTEAYNAPEALRSEDHPCTTSPPCAHCYGAAKAECWALGVLLYVMLNVAAPYDAAEDSLTRNAKPYLYKLSEPAKLLLSRLLRRDPATRWGVQEINAAAWLRAGAPTARSVPVPAS